LFEEGYRDPGGANGHPELIHDLVIFSGFGTQASDRELARFTWPDTSTATTMIWNTITDPTRKNREKFGKHPSQARTEAWSLGLWNLELCL
jgi:hypothetical protein